MRPLVVVDATNPLALLTPLREALFENGPAVMPQPEGASLPWSAPAKVPDSVALVLETSGSTGHPKRVGLSAEALIASAKAAEDALGGPGSWLLVLPVHYVAGAMVLVRSLVGGREPVSLFPETFSPEALSHSADQILEASVSHPLFTSLVPAQLNRILEHAQHDEKLHHLMSTMDRILVGGQAIPAGLWERAIAVGYRVMKTYGATETAGGCVWDGYPIGNTRVAIIDECVALSGPSLAEGYLFDEERTARSFVMQDGSRWYRSDDLGTIDATGKLTVTGRADDVLVSGGLKVSLGELETLLNQSFPPSIVHVVAVPNETWGEVPVVVSNDPLSLEAVRALAREKLGKAAQPHAVLVREQMPLLNSGKLDREALTEWAKEQL